MAQLTKIDIGGDTVLLINEYGQIVKDTLYKVEEYIQPGIKTCELDRIAEEFILHGQS